MNDQLLGGVVDQMLEHTITMDAYRDPFHHRYRVLVKASLIALLICLVSMPSAVDAQEVTLLNPDRGESKKLLAFTEFTRSAAIDIQDVKSKLSADMTSGADELSLAVFCSIHQVFEVRSPRQRLGGGEPAGSLRQLGAAQP